MVENITSLYLLEVGIILPTDSHHSLLESLGLVPKILKLQLDDSFLCQLLMEKFPHLIGLEKETLTDITNQYPEKKPYLGFLLSEHPPKSIDHVQIGPSLKRLFISWVSPQSRFTLQRHSIEKVFHGMGQAHFFQIGTLSGIDIPKSSSNSQGATISTIQSGKPIKP